MGLSPLEGLVMGTRSGNIDPAIIFHLHRVAGMRAEEIDDLLNKRSGLLGLCGDSDMREVLRRDDAQAKLALDVYCARIKGYVGAYLARLGGVDAITFTAGIGENSALVRTKSLSDLEVLGIAIDDVRNSKGEAIISPDGSKVAVCVVPTDEELEIATQTAALLA
jgi:acetate kinase